MPYVIVYGQKLKFSEDKVASINRVLCDVTYHNPELLGQEKIIIRELIKWWRVQKELQQTRFIDKNLVPLTVEKLKALFKANERDYIIYRPHFVHLLTRKEWRTNGKLRVSFSELSHSEHIVLPIKYGMGYSRSDYWYISEYNISDFALL